MLRGNRGMKVAWTVASGLVLFGAVVKLDLGIRRYRAQAEIRTVTTEFSGERAFDDLKEMVKLGPPPPGSQALEKARQHITGSLGAAGALVRMDSFVAR